MSAESGTNDTIVLDNNTQDDFDRDKARAQIEKTCDGPLVQGTDPNTEEARAHIEKACDETLVQGKTKEEDPNTEEAAAHIENTCDGPLVQGTEEDPNTEEASAHIEKTCDEPLVQGTEEDPNAEEARAHIEIQIEKACDEPPVQGKTKEDLDREEARAHIEKTCDELQVKDAGELKRLAKIHRHKTACTEYDEVSDKYRYLPCFGTKIADLGVYGSGITLYFHFIFQMGIVFFFCGIITSGNLILNTSGGMVVENNAVYRFFGMSTIANLGACESGRCSTTQELEDRCIMDSFPCPMRLKEITQWIGLADGLAILFIMAWGLFFQKYWIPRVRRNPGLFFQKCCRSKEQQTDVEGRIPEEEAAGKEKQDNRLNVFPSDFAVDVTALPANLAPQERHENYKDLMKEHFERVLDDPAAIQEVALVREYGGSIKKFMQKGEILHKQQGDLIKLKQLKGRDDEASKEKIQALEEAAIKKFLDMKKIDEILAEQAKKKDENRSVVRAFVTFSKEAHQKAVLEKYRFSRYWLFRCFQDKSLNFEGSAIRVQKACEPSDLFWENLDYPWTWRLLRKGCVLLLTVIILVLCSLALFAAQSMATKTLASGNDQLVWIVKTTPKSNATCMELCDVDLFSDRECSYKGQTSELVKTFDASKDYTNFNWSHTSNLQCSGKWTSPACSSRQACANNASRDWLGFQFQSPRQAQCFQLKLAQLVEEVQLFGCMSPPPDAANRGCWKVEDHCEPMYANDLSYLRLLTGQAYVDTGNQQISADMTCSATIADDVARERWESFPQGSPERTSNPVLSCFCQQQLFNRGPQFLLPPYDISAKQICEEWSGSNNALLGKLLLAATAVAIVNNVLHYIYVYMAMWERHCTATEVAQSQFCKLFLATFTNTGLLVLLVNASLKLPAVLQPLRVLSIGTGQYDDFSISWYISVGFGLCLTICFQIFSTTVSPLLMSFVLTPCMAWICARGEVVEARMNLIYQLPEWGLSLRIAETLTVFFVVCTYSSGMPGLYIVGVVYSVVAFWLDKWCLLHGSAKPAAINDIIWQTCMHFVPVAAFLHTALACWTFGNKALVPSDWSLLRPIAEMAFGISLETYTESINAYRNAADSLKGDLQSDYFNARMLDFARSSCWLLLLIFLTFCVYYIIFWVLKLFLYPFVAPCLFAVKDACRRAQSTSHVRERTWEECQTTFSKYNTTASYTLEANHTYHSAYLAISHTSKHVGAAAAAASQAMDLVQA